MSDFEEYLDTINKIQTELSSKDKLLEEWKSWTKKRRFRELEEAKIHLSIFNVCNLHNN